MKVQHYQWLMAAQASRRAVLKGAASPAALALASGGALGRAYSRRPARRTICARRS